MANYKRKKVRLSRRPKDAATKKRERRFLIVFAVLLVIVASASTITFIKERNKEKELENPDNEITLYDGSTHEGKFGIMFVPISPEDQILYICAFTFDSSTNTYSVGCFNTPKNATREDPQKLLEAVNREYDLSLSSYCIITREQFKEFTQAVGGYAVTLKSRVDYSDDDFSISLSTGDRTLYGNQFFDYLRFIGLSGTDHERQTQAEILADYVRQKMNAETVANGDTIFSRIANNCTTDITIVDFNKYQSIIEESVQNKPKVTVIELEKDK